jgi:hypothetical protein
MYRKGATFELDLTPLEDICLQIENKTDICIELETRHNELNGVEISMTYALWAEDKHGRIVQGELQCIKEKKWLPLEFVTGWLIGFMRGTHIETVRDDIIEEIENLRTEAVAASIDEAYERHRDREMMEGDERFNDTPS